MRTIAAFAILACAGLSQGQLAVDSFRLGGSYSASAFAGSVAGDLDIGPQPGGYLEVVNEATLTDETGQLSATFFALFEGRLTDDGFRVGGWIISEPQPVAFYEQSHAVSNEVVFTLDRPALVRVAGRIAHQPEIGPGAINPTNGTEVSLSTAAGPLQVLLSETVGPVGGAPAVVDLDAELDLDAGVYRIDIDSLSSGVGSFSPGLLNVDTSWDLSITVVPAPSTLVLAPLGLLALRRRR